jgi:nucleoid-associated protein YgaU
VPPEQLRFVLEELQRVAENAVASAVDSDLNAAIGQAAKTIETLGQARQKHENRSERGPSESGTIAPPPTAAAALESAGSRSMTFDFRFAMKRKSTGREMALQLGHALHPWRWHVVALAGVLLLAGISAITLNHAPQNQSAATSSRDAAYGADPEDAGNAQVITVLVRPNQTLEQLSVLYVGHFDAEVFKEIRALNAGLNDPNHIEPGQFLRLPLPHGTLKKVTDMAETSTASPKPVGLFSRIASLWRGEN